MKLLRAIQEQEIQRVGDTKDTEVDVRLIAATNKDLEAAVGDGTLREDLFYRLNVILIHLFRQFRYKIQKHKLGRDRDSQK